MVYGKTFPVTAIVLQHPVIRWSLQYPEMGKAGMGEAYKCSGLTGKTINAYLEVSKCSIVE